MKTDELKVWFPIKRGLMRKTVGHVKASTALTIELRKGETLGVVGESGSGKIDARARDPAADLLRRADRCSWAMICKG